MRCLFVRLLLLLIILIVSSESSVLDVRQCQCQLTCQECPDQVIYFMLATGDCNLKETYDLRLPDADLWYNADWPEEYRWSKGCRQVDYGQYEEATEKITVTCKDIGSQVYKGLMYETVFNGVPSQRSRVFVTRDKGNNITLTHSISDEFISLPILEKYSFHGLVYPINPFFQNADGLYISSTLEIEPTEEVISDTVGLTSELHTVLDKYIENTTPSDFSYQYTSSVTNSTLDEVSREKVHEATAEYSKTYGVGAKWDPDTWSAGSGTDTLAYVTVSGQAERSFGSSHGNSLEKEGSETISVSMDIPQGAIVHFYKRTQPIIRSVTTRVCFTRDCELKDDVTRKVVEYADIYVIEEVYNEFSQPCL